MSAPSPNGDNGRDAGGRFTQGNAGGPGNPLARRVARLRAELLRAIVAALVAKAKQGDTVAAREVLDRAIGKAAEGIDLVERIEALEACWSKRHDDPTPA